MIHLFISGILLGWGAAIPIGPLNIEIIRRHLKLGWRAGLGMGLGASSGDLTYLALLSFGALSILNHPTLLHIMSGIGAFILAWFGYQALKSNPEKSSRITAQSTSFWHHLRDGYLLILVNPYTLLFWLSVSSQVALLAHHHASSGLALGLGVTAGVLSWVIAINCILHHTKHYLPQAAMRWLSRIGGLIILGFAIFFLSKALT